MKVTPRLYHHVLYAFPREEGVAFPVTALAYDAPHGLYLTPNSERDSSCITLNPVFGPPQPLFLSAFSQFERCEPFSHHEWNFSPVDGTGSDREHDAEIAKRRFDAKFGVPGRKMTKLQYLHFARVEVRLGFPFDMLRYSRCVPARERDALSIVGIEDKRRGGEVYVAKLTDSRTCNWWTDRWESFGVKFETVGSLPQ